MSNYYILEGKEYKQATLSEWAEFMNTTDKEPYYRHVARDYFFIEDAPYCDISTVFLGIDHSFSANPTTPILFESMIFGGELGESQERYPTWDQAAFGHQLLHAKVDTLIRSRFQVKERTAMTVHPIAHNYRYRLVIPAHIEFTIEDMRLLREN